MDSTAEILEYATGGSVRHKQIDRREWVSINHILPTQEDALAFVKATRAYLTQSGWDVVAFSNGFRPQDGQLVYTAGIDAMRGNGPYTEWERMMQGTCTGRD